MHDKIRQKNVEIKSLVHRLSQNSRNISNVVNILFVVGTLGDN